MSRLLDKIDKYKNQHAPAGFDYFCEITAKLAIRLEDGEISETDTYDLEARLFPVGNYLSQGHWKTAYKSIESMPTSRVFPIEFKLLHSDKWYQRLDNYLRYWAVVIFGKKVYKQ